MALKASVDAQAFASRTSRAMSGIRSDLQYLSRRISPRYEQPVVSRVLSYREQRQSPHLIAPSRRC